MSFDRLVAVLPSLSLLCLGCAASAPSGAAAGSGRDDRTAETSEPAAGSTPAESAPGEEQSAAPSALDTGGARFLSSIPAHVSDRAKALIEKSTTDDEFSRALRVRLQVMRGYKTAGELSRRSKVRPVNGTFQLSDLSQLGSRDTPTKATLASSFIVDFDEPSVKVPADELSRGGHAATPAEIASFVGRYIEEKSYARSFDVASRVAVTRSGDCTEHAVLTAALLRRFGFRARLVLGIVLLGVSGGGVAPTVQAFGHAWVEHHDQGRWAIVDAALGGPECASAAQSPTVCGVPQGATRRLAYLPIAVVTDETVSFNRALMDQPGVESVTRIEIDAASGT